MVRRNHQLVRNMDMLGSIGSRVLGLAICIAAFVAAALTAATFLRLDRMIETEDGERLETAYRTFVTTLDYRAEKRDPRLVSFPDGRSGPPRPRPRP